MYFLPNEIQCLCQLCLFTCFGSRTRDWTQDFVLARQALYHLKFFTIPFCTGYFWEGSLFMPWPAEAVILLFALLWIAGMTGMSPDSAMGWDGISWKFCQDWLQTTILLISIFQVVGHRIEPMCPAFVSLFAETSSCREHVIRNQHFSFCLQIE
jgi:hypothetical protein